MVNWSREKKKKKSREIQNWQVDETNIYGMCILTFGHGADWFWH